MSHLNAYPHLHWERENGICDGFPEHSCGRRLSGDGWCIVHNDRETRENRWARNGQQKADVDTTRFPERLPTPRVAEQRSFGW